MQTPWVNIAYLFLLVLMAVTGYFGFTSNEEPEAWLLWVHGIGAYSLIVLMLFKGGVILDAWRRKKRWTWPRVIFALTLVLLFLTTIAGMLWTFAGPLYLGGFSLVSIHIYLAIPLLLFMAWHAWRMRFIWRVPGALGRRLFLGSLAGALAGLTLWRGSGAVSAAREWPGSVRRFTGSYETGSYTTSFPSVSWIADRPSPVDDASWQLRVEGVVTNPLLLDYSALLNLPQIEMPATLDCTGGWYTKQMWRGVLVGDLLDRAGLSERAASVTFEAVSGYKRRFDLDVARFYLLAVGTVTGAEAGAGVRAAGDGSGLFEKLSHGHGYPVRLVAPDRRGVEWVKWVSVLRVNETSAIWQMPLPIQ